MLTDVIVTTIDLFDLGSSFFSGDIGAIGRQSLRTLQNLLIPNYGAYSGAGYGRHPNDRVSHGGAPFNTVDYASWIHDGNSDEWQWIQNTFFGDNNGDLPPTGPIGQLYSLLGVLPFFIQDCIENGCGP